MEVLIERGPVIVVWTLIELDAVLHEFLNEVGLTRVTGTVEPKMTFLVLRGDRDRVSDRREMEAFASQVREFNPRGEK